MKTNGATWNRYLDSWPEGQWFDDSDETYNGREPVENLANPDDVVEFSCGVVFAGEMDKEGIALPTHFRRWLKAQTITSLVCDVPNDKLEEFKALLLSMGGKVNK